MTSCREKADRQSVSVWLTLFVILAAGNLASGCSGKQDPVVAHGEPGVRPFWNVHSGRYIYAPSIAWTDTLADVDTYIVEIGSKTLATSDSWANLSEVWQALDDGGYTVVIRALDTSGLSVIVDSIHIIKSPGFRQQTATSYHSPYENGMKGLEAVFRMDKVQHWLNPGGPFPGYQLWVHPSKLMGVLSQGMLFLSRNSEDPYIQQEARQIAIRSANFLMRLREPQGSPLAGWTHSYWDGVERGEHPIYMDQIMTLYPSEAAMAFLDLFDATSDSTYFAAAIAIAETYENTQRDDGTWYLLQRRVDGSPVGDKLLVPVSVINFFDRLNNQYGLDEYVDVREQAFEWILENPVKTYAWEAQFEDTRPKRRYRNLSHREAANFARLLFETSTDANHLALAKELLLFAEDQFVIWSHDDHVTNTNWFREGMKWNGNRRDGQPGKRLVPSCNTGAICVLHTDCWIDIQHDQRVLYCILLNRFAALSGPGAGIVSFADQRASVLCVWRNTDAPQGNASGRELAEQFSVRRHDTG